MAGESRVQANAGRQMRAGEQLRNQRARDLMHEVKRLVLHNTTCLA
jgi:hypothetical protein